MHPKSPKSLEDIAIASGNVVNWTTDTTLTEYSANAMLRAATERTFEIIGEAHNRLERSDPQTATRITDYRRIIGFRNRLAHGYDDVDDQQVWEIIQTFLPTLRAEVDALLAEIEPR